MENFLEWFDVSCGLKQGCVLSIILFNLYINDLIVKIDSLNLGIEIDGEKVGMLVHADDIVLLAENEEELQQLLHELNLWCENKLKSVPANPKLYILEFSQNHEPM